MLTKGKLAVALSKLKGFANPKAALEQYVIPSEIAATVLWQMLLKGDIEGKVVADLGAGTGILGLGCALLGARKVYLVDGDREALIIAKENAKVMEEELGMPLPLVFCQSDINSFTQNVDVVVQNPPFGVQKEHADRRFLEQAFSIAPIVYSFHKAESELFLHSFAQDHDFAIIEYWTFSWPLKATLHFHTQRKHAVLVNAYCFIQRNYLNGKNIKKK